MSAAHTPGPWMFQNKYGVLCITAPTGRPVMRQWGHLFDDMPADVQRREADFRLIAAAPELLRIVEDLRQIVVNALQATEHNHVLISMDRLDAERFNGVIEKARGGK